MLRIQSFWNKSFPEKSVNLIERSDAIECGRNVPSIITKQKYKNRPGIELRFNHFESSFDDYFFTLLPNQETKTYESPESV